jgi:CopA family copper-resistance protein
MVDDQGFNRRHFIRGIAAAFLAHRVESAAPDVPAILSGDHFDLVIDWLPVNITGRRVRATAVNGSMPCPILKWREGDTVTLAVHNRLSVPTSIHWHGIRSPADMDGVPGLSFRGIAPGETFVYRIPVKQSGTYWYHSHSSFQEQTGLAGALLIEPKDRDPIESDRDYVLLLTDWTNENPATVFDNLKKQSDYYNYYRRTAGTFFSDAKKKGLRATVSDRLMWGRMNMTPTDIADVTSATYTYLVNGKPPVANWTALFEPGQRVRLRFINGSSMTLFDVRMPGLQMTVVQTDGNDVQPVKVDEFRIGVAETYDVIVKPDSASAYAIFAQPMTRYGFARATLAPKIGMSAQIPPMDPRPMRTMMDMGMGGMGGMAGMGGMPGMSGMGGMQNTPMASTKRSDPAVATNRNHIPTEPFPQPDLRTTRFMPARGEVPSHPAIVSHPQHIGPSSAMVVMNPKARFNDPGDGSNGNGRRVLTYADLRARYPGVDGRPPSRQIELHLTGNMERFIWGFDGYLYSQAEPVNLKLGERVRIVLINDTMMEYPIHLHGLWSELENGHNEFSPYKHTLIVKPAERISFLVSADTPGRWAFHCHLLYHMAAGMFRTVIVS